MDMVIIRNLPACGFLLEVNRPIVELIDNLIDWMMLIVTKYGEIYIPF